MFSHTHTHRHVQRLCVFLSCTLVHQKDRADQRLNTEACQAPCLQCYMNIHCHNLCHVYVCGCDALAASAKWSSEHAPHCDVGKHIGQLCEMIWDTVIAKWQTSLKTGFYECVCTAHADFRSLLQLTVTWLSPSRLLINSLTHSLTHNPYWLLLRCWCMETNQDLFQHKEHLKLWKNPKHNLIQSNHHSLCFIIVNTLCTFVFAKEKASDIGLPVRAAPHLNTRSIQITAKIFIYFN